MTALGAIIEARTNDGQDLTSRHFCPAVGAAPVEALRLGTCCDASLLRQAGALLPPCRAASVKFLWERCCADYLERQVCGAFMEWLSLQSANAERHNHGAHST